MRKTGRWLRVLPFGQVVMLEYAPNYNTESYLTHYKQVAGIIECDGLKRARIQLQNGTVEEIDLSKVTKKDIPGKIIKYNDKAYTSCGSELICNAPPHVIVSTAFYNKQAVAPPSGKNATINPTAVFTVREGYRVDIYATTKDNDLYVFLQASGWHYEFEDAQQDTEINIVNGVAMLDDDNSYGYRANVKFMGGYVAGKHFDFAELNTNFKLAQIIGGGQFIPSPLVAEVIQEGKTLTLKLKNGETMTASTDDAISIWDIIEIEDIPVVKYTYSNIYVTDNCDLILLSYDKVPVCRYEDKYYTHLLELVSSEKIDFPVTECYLIPASRSAVKVNSCYIINSRTVLTELALDIVDIKLHDFGIYNIELITTSRGPLKCAMIYYQSDYYFVFEKDGHLEKLWPDDGIYYSSRGRFTRVESCEQAHCQNVYNIGGNLVSFDKAVVGAVYECYGEYISFADNTVNFGYITIAKKPKSTKPALHSANDL